MKLVGSLRLLIAVAATFLCATAAFSGSCPLTRVRDRTFPISPGVYINYRVAGQGGGVIIAFHGFGSALDTWNEIEPELAARYRIFMPDLPGFGLSAKPKAFGYTLREQANALAAFVKFVQQQTGAPGITLVGHSYGGSISLAVCRLLKERHEPFIDKLILVDALGFPREVHFPLYISILRVPLVNRLVLNILPAKRLSRIVLKHTFFNQKLVTPQRACRYGQFMDLPGAHRALIRTARQLGNAEAIAEFTQRLGEIDAPTLILWGSHDRLIPPSQAGLLEKAIPHSEQAPLLEAGHVPHEELPAPTAALLESFLGRPAGSRLDLRRSAGISMEE